MESRTIPPMEGRFSEISGLFISAFILQIAIHLGGFFGLPVPGRCCNCAYPLVLLGEMLHPLPSLGGLKNWRLWCLTEAVLILTIKGMSNGARSGAVHLGRLDPGVLIYRVTPLLTEFSWRIHGFITCDYVPRTIRFGGNCYYGSVSD